MIVGTSAERKAEARKPVAKASEHEDGNCRTAREASIRTSITDFPNSELRSAVIDGCEGDARRAGLERRAVENRAEPRSPRPWAMPHVVNNGFCEENTTTLLRATSTAHRTCGTDSSPWSQHQLGTPTVHRIVCPAIHGEPASPHIWGPPRRLRSRRAATAASPPPSESSSRRSSSCTRRRAAPGRVGGRVAWAAAGATATSALEAAAAAPSPRPSPWSAGNFVKAPARTAAS